MTHTIKAILGVKLNLIAIASWFKAESAHSVLLSDNTDRDHFFKLVTHPGFRQWIPILEQKCKRVLLKSTYFPKVTLIELLHSWHRPGVVPLPIGHWCPAMSHHVIDDATIYMSNQPLSHQEFTCIGYVDLLRKALERWRMTWIKWRWHLFVWRLLLIVRVKLGDLHNLA